MSSFRITPSASRDLDEIYDFVAAENLPAAGRILERFLKAFRTLAGMPGMGHFRPDLTEEPLRFWLVSSYLIVYRPETEPLEIIRVLHGARDLAELLAERHQEARDG